MHFDGAVSLCATGIGGYIWDRYTYMQVALIETIIADYTFVISKLLIRFFFFFFLSTKQFY